MATITTRAGKGSPLTNTEVDDNFSNLNSGKAELAGAAFTGAITTNSTFDGRDVAVDGTKLDGIEASADVTDTANVTAAGALMDTEVTNLAQVKAFDSSDYATAAQGTTANAALPKAGGAMTGAITTNSTFDGRDVATDGTKLDGIEASADVTDTANVTAAGALMDSELTAIASVKALNQGVATTDDPTFTNTQLAAIAQSKSVTAVDVFVYDTSKDSDGGAWRHRTQHTSWYNETLNTSTRGARKEFPCVAVIVSESDQVTIYDGDDPDMPMWMVFSGSALIYAATRTSLVMLIGLMFTSGSTSVSEINFITEFMGLHQDSSVSQIKPAWKTGIIGRYNGAGSWTTEGGGTGSVINAGNQLVNRNTNDVAMTVLPTAPIDADTGLPVPTIAVATDGGVSVIKDDGSVVDITVNNASYTSSHTVDFLDDNSLGLSIGTDVQTTQDSYYIFQTIPVADNVITVDYVTGTTQNVDEFYSVQKTNAVVDLHIDGSEQDRTLTAVSKNAYGTSYGVSVVDRNKSAADKGMVAYISSDYNTGWMNGDIKLAALSDTDTADVVGTNLIANSNFSSGTSGWAAYGGTGTIANVGNRLQFTTGSLSGTLAGCIYAVTGLTVGKTYYYEVEVETNGSSPSLRVQISGLGLQTASGVTSSANTVVKIYDNFVAWGSTHHIEVLDYSAASGDVFYMDNINLSLAEPDRSVNVNGLQAFGTVTKTAVATGADLVAYGGFSASNYLTRPHNNDFEFGTGNWSMTGWISQTGTASTQHPIQLGLTTGSSSEISILRQTSSAAMLLGFRVRGDSGSYAANPVGGLINPNVWTHFVLTKSGSQLLWYINGKLLHSAASSTVGNIGFSSSDILRIGYGASTVTSDVMKLALLRISATAPSLEQITKMYNDEKHLFATNAKATIYGTSNNTSAIAYDDDTELLHAGTSAGRSVFQGLNRVDNTTDAVSAAISASNGFIVEE
jgi:hypothetical protein